MNHPLSFQAIRCRVPLDLPVLRVVHPGSLQQPQAIQPNRAHILVSSRSLDTHSSLHILAVSWIIYSHAMSLTNL